MWVREWRRQASSNPVRARLTMLLRFLELDPTSLRVPAWRRRLHTDWELRRTACDFFPHPRMLMEQSAAVCDAPLAINAPGQRPVPCFLRGAAAPTCWSVPYALCPRCFAEVTPGWGNSRLGSNALANCFDGEGLHLYQPSPPPRIAIRGLGVPSALLEPNQNRFRPVRIGHHETTMRSQAG